MLIFKARRIDNNEYAEGPLDLNLDNQAWIEVNGEKVEVHTEDLTAIGEIDD